MNKLQEKGNLKMKNNVLKILAFMIIGLICISALNTSYAASVCTIKGFFSPSNPKQGQEVTVEISADQINEAIAGVGFTLEYDTELFDYISEEVAEEWDLTKTDSLFTILTKNNEATTKTGKIIAIKLKVKENVNISTTPIKISHIEVTTDTADTVNIEDITQEINITSNQEQEQGQQEQEQEEQEQQEQQEQQNNIPAETENKDNNQNNNSSNEKPTTTTDVDTNRIKVINGDKSNNDSLQKTDSSTATKKLPKTGIATISFITIAISIIVSIICYNAYRKYKNI